MRIAALHLACTLAAFAPVAAAAQEVEEAVDEALEEATTVDGYHTEVVPYIEAAQVVTAQIDPFEDVVTYTSVAVGVDASIAGRNSAASVSLRYERYFGWEDDTADGDTISGVLRAGLQVTPGLTIEGGAYAAESHVESDGSTSFGGLAAVDDSTSQIYSAYVGPSLHTMAGDVEVQGHYRFGYTKVEEPDAVVFTPGGPAADIIDESTVHFAYARAGIRPDVVAPIGVGIGAGYNQQDISNLDQRIRDAHVRADVTVPVSPTVALVGGVGYEELEVSNRDAVRDAAGNPVIGPDGRFVTDETSPRQIGYETEGLIWDVGVMWRPSRRTALEAYAGRRYGNMNYHGTFSYAPNARESYNLAVYDNFTGFGGAMVDGLAGLPTQFDAFRNPITGQVATCVGSQQGGNCLASALGSLRSGIYRSRGIAFSHSLSLGHTQIGTGAGYDKRRFVGAEGTVLEDIDGLEDENVWLAVYGSRELDARSSLSGGASINWFEGTDGLSTENGGYTASIAYHRELLEGLSATAALGLDGVSRENLPNFLAASGLVALRYSFFDR